MNLQDIKYTVKLLRGIVSGFDGLQEQDTGKWDYIANTSTFTRKPNGEWTGQESYDTYVHSYYVCVRWNNGSHTPLPIVLDDGDYDDTMQSALVRAMIWLHAKSLAPSAWTSAFKACAYYQHQEAQ